MIKRVYQFQKEVIKIPFPKKARMLPKARLAFAYNAFDEENTELLTALTFNDQADAILDLMYFAIGRLYEMGIPEDVVDKYFNNVHIANMNKERGMTERGSEDDASKPEGWKPPFHDIGEANGKQ